MRQLCFGLVVILCGCGDAEDTALQQFESDAQIAIGQLAGNLQTALQLAMTNGGVKSALEVCQQQAPALAAAQSDEMQLQISRTSLKVRNPDNAPEPWQETVLKDFERQKKNGTPVDTLTFKKLSDDGSEWRLMQAIGTKPLCLNCHGSEIDPDVMAAIKQSYPEDKATGYRSGDIRGAFSVVRSVSD